MSDYITYNPGTQKVVPKDAIVLDFSRSYSVASILRHVRQGCGEGCSVVARLVDQIEEQTRPAIEEPTGLGAVVEDVDGTRWTHLEPSKHGANWARHQALGAVAWRAWSDLTPVRVLSEGVTS